jgi:hypothetical protein
MLTAVACTRIAVAQSLGASPSGYREYVSILGTPVGSLPPLATYTLAGLAQQSPQVFARYGFVQDMAQPLAPPSGGHNAHTLNSAALTGLVSTGLGGTVSLTAGLSNEHCTGCSGSSFMASIAGDLRIASMALDQTSPTRFTVAATAELGVGHPATGTAWTADLGVPLAFALSNETGTRIIPFITPSFALVTTHGGPTGDDVLAGRLLVGGGISLFNPKSALGGSVGFQYVFVDKTQLQFGVALSLGGR